MKNILVLTDFSENAKAAENYALQLAIKVRANIILYNSFSEINPRIANNVVWPHDEPVSQEFESISNLEARVRELKEKLKTTGPSVYHPEISHFGEVGSLVQNLNNVVNKYTIWLVVMGTKGEGFVTNLIFGSNVYKVLDEINHPVLIVPHNADFTTFRQLTFATDFRSNDLSIINWLKEFLKPLQATLFVEHVSPENETMEEVEDKKLTEEILFNETYIRTHVETIPGKDIVKSLHEVIENMNVGIIAMLYRKYGFFESLFHVSTTHKMIKHTQIPVLIFPESGNGNK